MPLCVFLCGLNYVISTIFLELKSAGKTNEHRKYHNNGKEKERETFVMTNQTQQTGVPSANQAGQQPDLPRPAPVGQLKTNRSILRIQT